MTPATKGAPVRIIVKKKAAHAAHHGGAWKVAYADFVTAMMALFIVLWLLSQTDQETRRVLSEYFRTGVFSGAPSVTMGGSGLLDKGFLDVAGNDLKDVEHKRLQDAAQQIKSAIHAAVAELKIPGLEDRVRVQVVEDGLLIQIVDGGDALLFDLSSAKLKPEVVELLTKLGPVLGRLQNDIQVHGHTDARSFPATSTNDNWKLSFARADNARAVLEQSGLRERQISGVFAHADQAPIVDDPYAASNRRLAILAVRAGREAAAARGVPSAEPLKAAPTRQAP